MLGNTAIKHAIEPADVVTGALSTHYSRALVLKNRANLGVPFWVRPEYR